MSLTTTALIISSCAPSTSLSPAGSISWEGLSQGQTVYGIVKLTARASRGNISGVKFYLDGTENNHLISIAESQGNSIYACDWYTQDFSNGNHVLYSVADFTEGAPFQASITVTVDNHTRADSIPPGVIKMTPANDPAPPQLAPAFKDLWYDPVPLAGPINTAGAEDSPFIMPDGNTFYFWFNGDESKDVPQQVNDPMTGIYVSKKINGLWGEPARLFLQYFGKLGFDGAQTVRGNTLWFASIREGNYRDLDIWTAEFINGKWTRWANAGERLNKDYEIGELHVTADGNEIYFGSPRAGGKGQLDIWVTRKVDGQWQTPENIEAVNTARNEAQPFISENGAELWFTRDIGGPAIFRSLKVGGKWQAPEMVVSPLAGEPTLDSEGNLYFTHHRWDSALNRVSEADIYVCYRKR